MLLSELTNYVLTTLELVNIYKIVVPSKEGIIHTIGSSQQVVKHQNPYVYKL